MRSSSKLTRWAAAGSAREQAASSEQANESRASPAGLLRVELLAFRITSSRSQSLRAGHFEPKPAGRERPSQWGRTASYTAALHRSPTPQPYAAAPHRCTAPHDDASGAYISAHVSLLKA